MRNEPPALTQLGDSDAEDVSRATRGDTGAFERLYLRHAGRMFALSSRFVGREFAAEATQDIFVHIWERLGQFRGEAQFSTWLYRIAVNMLLRRAEIARRLAGRTAPLLPELMAPPAQVDARLDIESALHALAPALREVVILHDIDGLGHQEIAAILGISVSASKMRLHRGRTLLREHLS